MLVTAATDPLTAATWITALATAVLAVFAILTPIFAIKAFRKQSTEVGLLQKQAEREAEDRRWAQATLMYVTAKICYARRGGTDDDGVGGPSLRRPRWRPRCTTPASSRSMTPESTGW